MTKETLRSGLIAISAALMMSAVTLGATLSPAQAGTVQIAQAARA